MPAGTEQPRPADRGPGLFGAVSATNDKTAAAETAITAAVAVIRLAVQPARGARRNSVTQIF